MNHLRRVADDERRDSSPQFFGDLHGFAADFGQQNSKLFAAEPPDVITGAELLPASGKHFGEHLIASRVTVAVVRRFEMIDVEHDAGEIAVVPFGSFDFLVRLGEKSPPRHGAGQGIDECELAQLKLVDDQTSEVLQNVELLFADLTRLHVHDAESADVVSAGRAKRHADIRPDMRLIRHQRAMAKPAVSQSILHDERLILLDRVGAKGNISRGRLRCHPLPRLEPLAIAIDERYRGNRHLQRHACETGDAIERLLRRSVQDIVVIERLQTRLLFRVGGTLQTSIPCGEGHSGYGFRIVMHWRNCCS